MNARALVQLYLFITTLTAFLFIMLGLSGIFQQIISTKASSPLHKMATHISSQWFIDVLAAELPGMSPSNTKLSKEAIVTFLFEWLTNLNPLEPKSMLVHAIPGLARQEAYLLHPSESVKGDDGPFDPLPPTQAVTPSKPVQNKPPIKTANPSKINGNDKRKAIFIYHSHNRESWIPELTHRNIIDPDQAFDRHINITLVGKRLASLLEKKGIGADAAQDDYPTTEKMFKYTKSYSYSIKTVREAIAKNGNYQFYFDLHRDSQNRKKTTVMKNGVAYAQIYFIVGGKNPRWQENYRFAREIHEKLEKRFPGLSKSIYAKNSHGNGVYNQTVSAQSSLLEVGGPYNTLEESYRTIEILADVITELYFENAEKVGGKSS
jgi:stage II sporulation protein P